MSSNNLRLQQKYVDEVLPVLKEELNIGNVMAVPKIEKIVLNIGAGDAVNNKRHIEDAVYTLTAVSGQKPLITKAKKAISNFKLRENMPVGTTVTLRGTRMYEFLERLITIALPRVKDFRGVSRKSFDGHGNYNFGLKENLVFLEVDRDKIAHIHGMDITICTSATDNDSARLLLEKMGLPFRK